MNNIVSRLISVCRSPLTVWSLRIVVGCVFIVSGVAKSLDIWGFVFKIEEYLTAWNMEQPRSLVVMLSIALSGGEFLLGCMLAVGAYRRTALWGLMAMMAFMLPLTLYVYIASPVPDCGCFGDFVKLSNAATFYKNLGITAALACLFIGNTRVPGLYHPYLQWISAALCALYIVAVGLFGFNIQPLVDFRSFPVGRDLASADIDEADDVDFEFIYERDGEQLVCSADSVPDATWSFVERRIVSGTQADERTELVILDGDEDVTSEVLASEGEQLLVVLPQYNRVDPSFTYAVNELDRYMSMRGGSLVEIASIPQDRIEEWRDLSMANYPIYRAESTTLKELSRGVMSLVYLVDGHIVWKRSLSSVDVDSLNLDGKTDAMQQLDYDGPMLMLWLTCGLLAALFLLYAADRGARYLKRQSPDVKSRKNE